ncbi:MAG: hypothetical protein LWW83_02520 [Azonexaceae bacterium]|uniref:hypothetical protein n=1 Tax=Azonexus sp. R2A61 TaxID=2744443 RepID=UPI001F2F4AC5|nr:hypothetical protein [Azonexus sp. R2A61]MCE1238788.1 hypothetical protein [Azonexaceae bacterium]
MNTPNTEIQTEEEVPTAEAAAPAVDIRRRLRDLLSIPERDRSDEQWDEIIELEIQLAPGNRLTGNEPAGGGMPRQGQGQGKPGLGAQQKKHRPRTKNNRRPRPQNGKPNPGGTQG